MKGIITIAVLFALMSCGNANDGDASTDTTNFNTTHVDTTTTTNAIGDTSLKMDPSTRNDTMSTTQNGNSDGRVISKDSSSQK